MKRYKDKSGNSGVAFYEAGDDYIIVRFTGNTTYLYTHQKPGKQHVARMKMLAEAGEGLATYINKFVRENYAKQL